MRLIISYILATFAFLLLSLGATADSNLGQERIRFSGFGTLGLTYGGDDGFRLRRDISLYGQPEQSWSFENDTLLGMQLDAKLTQDLGVTIQMIGKNRAIDGLEESLEWAFLDYRLTPELTIRAGRVGLDVYMLSDHRDVGFTHLWARPPSEFYSTTFYDYIDGIDLTYQHFTDSGRHSIKLFVGETTGDVASGSNHNEVKLHTHGITLTSEMNHWRTHLSYVSGEVQNNMDTSLMFLGSLNAASMAWPEAGEIANFLAAKGDSINYYAIGAAYDKDLWTVQAELAYTESKAPSFPLLSTYLSVGRRFGDVTAYGMISKAKDTDGRKHVPQAPPEFSALQQQVQRVYDGSYTDQHTLSFGFRWDLRHNLSLKAQWDHCWINPYGGALWGINDVSDQSHELDTLSVNLSFVF